MGFVGLAGFLSGFGMEFRNALLPLRRAADRPRAG